jgi:hypothetical protein
VPERERLFKVPKVKHRGTGKSPKPVKSKTVRPLPSEQDILERNLRRQEAKTKKHKLNRCQKWACSMDVFTPEDVRLRMDQLYEEADGDPKRERKADKTYARLQRCQSRERLCPSPQKRDEYRARRKSPRRGE